MSKEDVLAKFQKIWEKEEYSRNENGWYLYEDLRENTKNLMTNDREGVIEAVRCWLLLREVGRTEMAMGLAKDLTLKELKPDIEKVREDIIARRYYPAPDTYWADCALKALE